MKITKSQRNLIAAKAECDRLWRLCCIADGIGTDSKFIVFSDENPYTVEYNEAAAKFLQARKREAANQARRARHEAYTSCGLKAVRVNGKTFYE